MPQTPSALHQLATLHGILTVYHDSRKVVRSAEPQSLLHVLQLLGAPVATMEDVPTALRERRQALWQRRLQPVTVLWEHAPARVDLRLPAIPAMPLECHLALETGEVRHWSVDSATLPVRRSVTIEGQRYVRQCLSLPTTVPPGYHLLTVESAGQRDDMLLLCAPRHAYAPADSTQRTWGVFLPLYALTTRHTWGSGDFTALGQLTDWVAERGGGVVATLPLLSAFLDTPCDPSPYTPASRLFWNEFYIDVMQAPGLAACPAAQALLQSTMVQEAVDTARTATRVDYRRHMALKRHILEELAQHFFATQAAQHTEFQHYLTSHPYLEDYACFRATAERQGTTWEAWPAPQRDGLLTPADYDARARQYHLYVQWVAHMQLQAVAAQGQQAGVRLYLDVPLGVHGQSYDVWRERHLFVHAAAGGAPPDSVFTRGQNWGFPPLHPEAIREQHYRYCLAFLRHQMRCTGMLRLDHVMALHRLFWIPHGLEARQGVYVRYHAEEWYALLCLESHRHHVTLVGENLGTVPHYVNRAMTQRRLHRMYVLQYELSPDVTRLLQPLPAEIVASCNTHDMAPLAAYWQGLDLADLQVQGLLSPESALQAQQQRQAMLRILQDFVLHRGWLHEATITPDVAAVFQACLRWLGASPAQVVLLNAEDLWLETQPQNFPGTSLERPNWQNKARYPLEAWQQVPQVRAALRALQRYRLR